MDLQALVYCCVCLQCAHDVTVYGTEPIWLFIFYVQNIVEPREDSASSPGPPTTPIAPDPTTLSPRKKRMKTNPILEFLKQESAKQQKRHEETEAKTERFLSLFEKLVNKMPEQ